MDFGSACPARVHIENRQQALSQQDLAAEQSTMPYRAPELFDVKTGTTLNEKVDIWSLGCTLYAMAYGQSPFEVNMDQGGSVALAVLNNQYKFPTKEDHYSQDVKDAIKWMLTANPEDRPNIQQVKVLKKNDFLFLFTILNRYCKEWMTYVKRLAQTNNHEKIRKFVFYNKIRRDGIKKRRGECICLLFVLCLKSCNLIRILVLKKR